MNLRNLKWRNAPSTIENGILTKAKTKELKATQQQQPKHDQGKKQKHLPWIAEQDIIICMVFLPLR